MQKNTIASGQLTLVKLFDGNDGAPGVDANLLDWVEEWNTNKTVIDGERIITPKLFAGTKESNNTITGTAIGRFTLSIKNEKGEIKKETIDGVYGFHKGEKTFSIDTTGSVQLGNGEEYVRYNATKGKIEFGPAVELIWTDAINFSNTAKKEEWEKRLTHIGKDGIFTGTLDAKVVKALEIHAEQITSGQITAEYIDVESLRAPLITTGFIEGLELKFTQGTIGGWKIDKDSIYIGTKANTTYSFTSGFGSLTIGSTGIRGYKWRLDAVGGGAIAGGNIKWNFLGDIEFSEKVTLQWTEYADKKVDDIQVGGRNYCLFTSDQWSDFETTQNNHIGQIVFYRFALAEQWQSGDQITISFDYKYQNFVKNNTQEPLAYFVLSGDITESSGENLIFYDFTDEIDFEKISGTIRCVYTFTVSEEDAKNNFYLFGVLHDYISGEVSFRNLKIEKGSKATDWTPAQEDLNEVLQETENKLTRITRDGIYTGNLYAEQIKTGFLSADRIQAGSITADKLDAKSISAEWITADYINGLSLNFKQGIIGGWIINNNSLYHSQNSRHFIIHSTENDSALGGNKAHRGITLFHEDSVVSAERVKIIQMGALGNKNTVQTYSSESNYGFRIALRDGSDIFRVDKDGAHISNWNFDKDSIFRGIKANIADCFTSTKDSITIGSNGIRGYRWFFDSNGDAQIGTGDQRIKFNANSGKIEFGSEVSLNWMNPINNMRIGIQNYINRSIFTTAVSVSDILTADTGAVATIDTETKYQGYNTIKINQIEPISESGHTNRIQFSAVKNVTPASFSILVKASVDTVFRIRLGIWPAKDFPISTTWQLIKVENATPFAANFSLGVTTAGATYHIVHPMYVNGTKALDWAPSPTDLEERLTYIGPDGIYVGSLDAKYINAGTIDTARLNVNDLTAKIINSTNINAANLSVTKAKIGGFTIASETILAGNLNISSLYRRIVVYGTNAGVASGHRVQMYHTSNTDFGIKAWDSSGNTLFHLGSSNTIAGWTFDKESISKGGVKLGSDGSISNASFWKLNKNGSGELASGNIKWDAEGTVTFGGGLASNWASAMAQGRMMYRDPEFTMGMNDIVVYNNSTGGRVTVTRSLDTSVPTNSLFALVIQNTGTASPNCGGFGWGHSTKNGKIYVTKIIAKIPIGRNISFHTNSLGTGGKSEWLTPVAGTGKWTEYIIKITIGPSASTTNNFTITGSVGTSTTPVEWRVCYATVYDTTSCERSVTTISSTGIYTGRLSAEQVEALTCTFTQGTIGGWTINSNQISKNNVVFGSDGTISNSTKWGLNWNGSGYLANKNISWDTAGALTIASGKLAGWYFDNRRIASSYTGYDYGLLITNNNVRCSDTSAYASIGKEVKNWSDPNRPDDIYHARFRSMVNRGTPGNGIGIDIDIQNYAEDTYGCKVTSYAGKRSYGLSISAANGSVHNYGIFVSASGKQSYGVFSYNSPVRASGMILDRVCVQDLSTNSTLDFSRYNVFHVYLSSANKSISLPSEVNVKSYFGYGVNDSYATNFGSVFTIVYSANHNYTLTISNFRNNNGSSTSLTLNKGGYATFLCSRLGGFHYQLLDYKNS